MEFLEYTQEYTFKRVTRLPWWLRSKESAANTGDTGSTPSPGGQTCLEHPGPCTTTTEPVL